MLKRVTRRSLQLITPTVAFTATRATRNAGSATNTSATNATHANKANTVAFTDRDTNDETDYIAFVSNHTAGDYALYTDQNLTYNPSTNQIGANISGSASNAGYANSAGSATNAGYANSAGSATNATHANKANTVAFTDRDTNDETDYIAFVSDHTAGDYALYTDQNLTYNPANNHINANVPYANSAGSATNAGYANNAGTLGGASASTAANGSTIAKRDGNGDLFMRYGHSTYFNMSHAASNRNADTVFYSSTDAYIRKNTAASFRTSLNVPTRTGGDASGTWSINVNGNAAYAPFAGSATNAAFATNATYATNAGNISSSNCTMPAYIKHAGDTNTYFGFPSNDTYIIGTNNVERFRIDSAGRVGIGTASPDNKLEIADHASRNPTLLKLTCQTPPAGAGNESSTAIQLLGTEGTTYGGYIEGYLTQSVGSGLRLGNINGSGQKIELMRIADTGNVGIGTTNPATKLNIQGTSEGAPPTTGGEGTSHGIFRLRDNFSVTLDIGTMGAFPWTTWLQVADAVSMGIYYPLSLQPNGGSVGIGTTGPGARLHLHNGNHRVSNSSYTWNFGVGGSEFFIYNPNTTGVFLNYGATSWSGNSDIRLKKNIVEIESGLEKIRNIRAVLYHFNNDSDDTKKRLGFIAQDWLEQQPECVAHNETNGHMGMSYTETIPVICAATKELDVKQQKIEEVVNNLSDFTGQHRCVMKDVVPSDYAQYEGLIASANNNEYLNHDGSTSATINEALPIVSLTTKEKDKCCLGVISLRADSESHLPDDPTRVKINAVGEGGIWVVNTMGAIESGDYLTSSNVAGYAQRQESEFLANYTVAKVTQNCDFIERTRAVKNVIKELSNVTYYTITIKHDITKEEYDATHTSFRDIEHSNVYAKYELETLVTDVNDEYDIVKYRDEDGKYTSNVDAQHTMEKWKTKRLVCELDKYDNLPEEEKGEYALEPKTLYYKLQHVETKIPHEGYQMEVRQELVNVLDEHGQLQWEDTDQTEKAYKIRYLDASGAITDEANAVHIAAFVGCTYHCG
jgi:hypothetical protein